MKKEEINILRIWKWKTLNFNPLKEIRMKIFYSVPTVDNSTQENILKK
jgi:hypothetical protein